MKITSWNAKVNRPDAQFADGLAELITDTRPQVVVLQESEDYIDVLRQQFGDRWWVYAKRGWDESDNCPVLVWKGQPKQRFGTGWGVVRNSQRWVGPKGGGHPGRTWTWVKVNGVYVMSLHRATSGRTKNKEAFREEAHSLEKFIATHTDGDIIIFGDHNCGPRVEYPGSSARVAARSDARVVFDSEDPGIDYVIAKGQRGDVNRLAKKYGSDHHAAVYVEKK